MKIIFFYFENVKNNFIYIHTFDFFCMNNDSCMIHCIIMQQLFWITNNRLVMYGLGENPGRGNEGNQSFFVYLN